MAFSLLKQNGIAMVLAMVTIALISLYSIGVLSSVFWENKSFHAHQRYLKNLSLEQKTVINCQQPGGSFLSFIPNTLDVNNTFGIALYEVDIKDSWVGKVVACPAVQEALGLRLPNGEHVDAYFEENEKHDFFTMVGHVTSERIRLKLLKILPDTMSYTITPRSKTLASAYLGVEQGGFYRLDFEQWPRVQAQYYYRPFVISNKPVVYPYSQGKSQQVLISSGSQLEALACDAVSCRPLYELHFNAQIIATGVNFGIGWVVTKDSLMRMVTFEAADGVLINTYEQSGEGLYTQLILEGEDYYWETKASGKTISQVVEVDNQRWGVHTHWWLPKLNENRILDA